MDWRRSEYETMLNYLGIQQDITGSVLRQAQQDARKYQEILEQDWLSNEDEMLD